MNELAQHIFEDLDPEFYSRLKPGDFIVAGKNFGCGSSREQAPLAIKHANIAAVIAKSFARIFFRNAVNIGLMLIQADTDKIDDGDDLVVYPEKGIIKNLTKEIEIPFTPLPDFMLEILRDGGLVEHLKKHGGYRISDRR
jgi:3-isopropylmalate/(R)-2-methylmalate dehydratase small subunit